VDPVSQYVASQASARGINPAVALAVFQHESSLNPATVPGDGGSSFGVAQLHYGGINPKMPNPGLGDAFTAATGMDARDPKTWREQVQFALDNVKDHGWSDYATTRDKLGLSNFSGIGAGSSNANMTLLTGAPQQDFLGGGTNPAVAGMAAAAAAGIAPKAPAPIDLASAPQTDYLAAVTPSGATAAPAPGQVQQAPQSPPQSALTAPGGGLQFMNSLPVIGPGILKAGAAVNALASPYLGGGAPGGTFGERYTGERSLQATQMQEFAAQNPDISLATQIAGGVAGSAGLVAAAPAAFGINAAASLPVNALAGAVTNATLSGADAAARGGSLSNIGQSAAIGGVAGAAAPVLGAGMSAIGRGLTGGAIPADDAQLAQLATQKYNIPLTAPQVSASPGFKIAGSTLNRLPFSGAESSAQAQQAAFNRAVAGTLGESADRITPDVMNAARARIGSYYDAVAQNTNITVDPQFAQDIHTVLNNASQVLPKAEVEPLLKQAQNIVEKIDPSTKTISGATYQALTNTGAPLDRLIESQNPNLAFYADQLKRSLDQALERSAPPEQQALLQTADRQWAAMRTVQPIVAKSPTGDVSPALLAGRINAQTGNGMAFGYGGDLGELARIGQKFLKEPGSSNTAERLSTMAGTIGGVPNALLAAMHGDLMGAAGVALGVPAASLAVGRGVGGALRSQWLANALINRSLPGAARATTPAWLAAGALGGSLSGNALSATQ
jgi:hypothetical protein